MNIQAPIIWNKTRPGAIAVFLGISQLGIDIPLYGNNRSLWQWIGLIRFTPVKDHLTTEVLTAFLENTGFWAPVVYWSSGNWAELISFKDFFSIALFVFSFFIPKLIKKFKGEA